MTLTLADPGGKELGYAATLTAQTSIGTTITDLTSLSVSVTCDGVSPILIIAKVIVQQKTAASPFVALLIREGTTEHGGSYSNHYAADTYGVHTVMARLIPSAGAHTYKVSGQTANDTFNTYTGGGSWPNFIQVIQLRA